MPAELLRAVRARPLDHPRRARPGAARAAARGARAAAAARARRQGDRLVERARDRGARRGGRRLRRPEWIDAAERAAEFVLGPLSDGDGRLRRSWRDGRTSGAGYLDDYANVAHGLLELHVATGEPALAARGAAAGARSPSSSSPTSERGGFFLAPAGGEELIARTKDLDDNPMPSGNSMLAHVLLRLARLWGDDELERRAVSVFRLVAPGAGARARRLRLGALRRSTSTCSPPRELAVVGPVDSPVAQAALGRWQPRRSSPSARPTTCRCSPARASSTGARPSTPASASRARRRSRTRPTSRLRRCASA